VLGALLAEALATARAEGCHVLELVGLPRTLRQIAERWRPLARTMPVWPAYCRAQAGEVAEALARPDSWYLTSYDGDTTLI
jgi:hypothetical protein